MTRLIPVLAAVLMTLSGCLSGGGLAGTGIGSPIGKPAEKPGARVASSIVAAMDGGLIGGSIGSGLNEADRRRALEAEYRALEYTPGGQAVSWTGSGLNRRGQVVAAQPYRVGSQDCRQYTHTVFAGSLQQSARGSACRNPDGSWTPLT